MGSFYGGGGSGSGSNTIVISNGYKPGGSVTFANLPELIQGNLGLVFNITNDFTTDSNFIEGVGKKYPAGTNVAIVEPQTGVFKYDVFIGKILQNLVDGSSAGSARGISTAEEDSNYTMGEHAFAEGYGTKASGSLSHAEGDEVIASGSMAHAEGVLTIASGSASHAEGGQTTASRYAAHAQGNSTVASGDISHAEGLQTVSSGTGAHAEGYLTAAVFQYAHSEGMYTVASGKGSHVEGGNVSGSNDGVIKLTGVANSTTYTYNTLPSFIQENQSYFFGNTIVTIQDIDINNKTITLNQTINKNTNFTNRDTNIIIPTVASGYGSHAEGFQTTASSGQSHAEGYQTTASGTSSHAEGTSTQASGSQSHAEGNNTTANHASQHVFGEYNIVDSSNETSLSRGNYVEIVGNGTPSARSNARTLDWDGNEVLAGKLTVGAGPVNNMDVATKQYVDSSGINNLVDGSATGSVRGINSAAEDSNYTIGQNAFAEGSGTKASGNMSHAEGQSTTASNTSSHAEGVGTTASGYASHAEGGGTTASESNSHAEGGGTRATGNSSHAEGAGTQASGSNSHAEGGGTRAIGNLSHAEGSGTTASGENAHAEGLSTTASGSQSHAEGGYTTASGQYSHAEGNYTTAYGNCSHAEGYGSGSKTVNNTSYSYGAHGYASHAEGYNTLAINDYSHAEGAGTTASASQSHAEGASTIASGMISHAEGSGTTASGTVSHAEGQGTTASGINAHAEGSNTTANHASQHVFGEYNIVDSSDAAATARGNYVEIVGNGTSSTRSNARTLDWNGNETLAGKLTVGADPVNNMDVATKQYVDSYASGGSGLQNLVDGSATGSVRSVGSAVEDSNYTIGQYAFAEGADTVASGNYSHAEGYSTTANHKSQHVFGEYNVVDPSSATASDRGNYVQIVGNGATSLTRSNARTLDWNGNEVLAGKLTVGSDPTNNMDVATKQYVDNSGGLDSAAKRALLDCFKYTAWINENGKNYYEALRIALGMPEEWTYEWTVEDNDLPEDLSYYSYDWNTDPSALLVTRPSLDFHYAGDCELQIECKWFANSGHETMLNPQIAICTEIGANGNSGAKIFGNPTSAGRYVQTNISGSTASTGISCDEYHVYNLKAQDGTITLTVDNNVIGTGYGVSNNQYLQHAGILGNNLENCGLYIRSIKFKEL